MNEAIKNRIEQVRRGEVPEGYKNFRCGVVPSEWKQYCLEQLITNEAQYTDDTDKYPLFSLTIEAGIVSKSDRYERSHLVLKQDAYKIVRKGGFVINPMNLHLGAISRYDSDEDISVSGYYDVFYPSLEITSSDYMLNLLRSPIMMQYYSSMATGSLIEKQRVHYSIFKQLNIFLPCLFEQQKIAEMLTCCDQVISLKKQLLDEKRRQKQWLMKKLLDPDSGVKLQQYQDAWDVDRLDKLVFLVKDRYDTQYDQRTVSSVELENIESVTGRLINWNNDKIQKSTKTVFKEGDILFGKLRPYLRKAFVASFDGVCSTEIWVMRRKDRRINLKYLYYVLMSEEFITLASSTTGTKMPRAEWGLVGSFCVRVPSITEQEGIASILSAADHEIDLLEQELSRWQQKKKSLMQLLLTGIVRVNV